MTLRSHAEEREDNIVGSGRFRGLQGNASTGSSTILPSLRLPRREELSGTAIDKHLDDSRGAATRHRSRDFLHGIDQSAMSVGRQSLHRLKSQGDNDHEH